ncbi:MAG: heavy metal translocating P-type ATPase [Rickettsiales bacterium]
MKSQNIQNQESVRNKDSENNSSYFHIDGLRCARCIHAIESALQSEDDVTYARVNMSTNRLSLSWLGDENKQKRFMKIVESLGYSIKPFEETTDKDTEGSFLLRCMAVSGFAMGNIMLLSVVLWSSTQSVMGIATRDLMHWISALIALPTVIYAGRPFFRSAFAVLRHGHTNMDVPISLALILACAMSLFETINHGEHTYFDSAVMLLFFLLIGRFLDARARGKARENASRLLALMKGYATVIKDGKQNSVPISELKSGMAILVAAGEKVPTDAEVTEGNSDIDTSLVTGETIPRSIKKGDKIYGGTVNLLSPITCIVLKASEDSVLADIIRLMEKAEQGRAKYVRLADKAASLYTPVVHFLALAAFLFWYFIAGIAWQKALLIAITTLIITCPCALGLAVPVVQVLATGWLMKRGVMLKTGDAFERMSRIDSAVFDKTGTITQGKAELVGNYPDDELGLAASLAAHSKHPYSKAISRAYSGDIISFAKVKEITAIGVEAEYEGKNIRLGKADITDSGEDKDALPKIYLSENGKIITTFNFHDALRSGAHNVMSDFKKNGITTYLLSGDRKPIVEKIAGELAIDHYYGGIMPADKTEIIKRLQKDGHNVLMVGDGLNDAPSLAQADVSISPSSAVDITQNTADIVFQGDSLISVVNSWNMAKYSTMLVKQNFVLAVIYNCIAIPIALMGYATPLIAAIAMSLSSLIVIANSFRINLMKEEQ